jgi:D-inositol-3-phosphate glycosyltransferase
MLKIVNIGPAFPLRGGISNFNMALSNALINQGHNVFIHSFYMQYPPFLFPGKTQVESGSKPFDVNIYNTISSVNPLSWHKTAKKIKKQKPDLAIIHYWMPFMGPSLGYIARRLKRAGIPVIAITHNVLPHEKRMGDKFLTRYFLKSCNGFVALAKSVEDDLKLFIKNPVSSFIPHPVYDIFGEKIEMSQARKKLGFYENDNYLLFFGIVREYKGLDLMLEAMADQRLKDLNVKLVVAGEFYENKEKYTAIIQKYGLEQRVIIHDIFIPSEDVKNYFCACDMVTQTYHTATQSGVTQIAYQFEVPMLVTNVGGLAEIVPHQKVGYVTEKDPKAIADAIFDFYKNKRYAEFVTNVIKNKSLFSWDNMVVGILALREKIINKQA